MRKYISYLVILTFLPVIGCANIFMDSAKKDSDEAIFEDIQKLVDDSDWDNAITKLGSLSSSFKSRSDVIETWAGVYAGKCGLNFITYFNNLTSASLAGTTLFKYFMNAFSSTTVFPSYCDLAQTKMEEISALPSGRSSGQNLFMAILGMVKIGVYLRSLADADKNGTTDVTFDSCNAGVAPSVAGSYISDSDLNNVITGMGLISANITYLTAVLSNANLGAALTTITAVCGTSCGITDPAAVGAADRNMFRDILKTGPTNAVAPLGIESCANVLVAPCC